MVWIVITSQPRFGGLGRKGGSENWLVVNHVSAEHPSLRFDFALQCFEVSAAAIDVDKQPRVRRGDNQGARRRGICVNITDKKIRVTPRKGNKRTVRKILDSYSGE